jgi:DNA-binding transcriptional LysR family regulator
LHKLRGRLGGARALYDLLKFWNALPVAIVIPDGPLTGQLVVDCFVDLAPFCAPAIIALLRKRHPKLDVTVHEFDLETVGKRLKAGASDVAISYELGLSKGLITETLQRVTPHALLSPDDPLLARKRIDLRALCTAPLILTGELLSAEHFFELFRRHGVTPVKTLEAGSLEMQRIVIGAGIQYPERRRAGN